MKTLNRHKATFAALAIILAPSFAFAQSQNVRAINGPNDNPPYAAVKPYWVDRPIIEVIGRSSVEFMPNYAEFVVGFSEVHQNSDEATNKVTEKVRPIIEKLRTMIGENGRINAEYERDELYQQYRDKDGNRIANEREDKIENYVAKWRVRVQLYDISLVSKVRGELLAIGGAEMKENIQFSFEPSPAQSREVRAAAMRDGYEMAKTVASAHGKTPKLLVFEEGKTQCLSSPTTAGGTIAPSPRSNYASATETVVVTGSRIRKLTPEQMTVAIAPEPIELSASVCMVYAIE